MIRKNKPDPAAGSQEIKAFLLAAGRGERLRPLTDSVPKCLLPINGKPLLQIWLEYLIRNGIAEVLINTHWLHEQVASFVKRWQAEHHGLKVVLSHETGLLGSAGTIRANRHWAGRGPFFIIYADNLSRLDLRKMLACHLRSRQPLTIRVYHGADPKRSAIVRLDENERIIDFKEKPGQAESKLGAGGIYIADARIFDYYPRQAEKQNRVLDLSYDILPRMTGRMQAYKSNELSMDIGTHESLKAAKKKWQIPEP